MKLTDYSFCPPDWAIDNGHGFDHLTAAAGGDADDFMERRKRGWRLHTCWGADGWDTPEYPYVLFLTYTDEANAIYACATRVEGDLYVDAYDNAAERNAKADSDVWWYWRQGYRTPPGFDTSWTDDEVPDRFRGPFTLARGQRRGERVIVDPNVDDVGFIAAMRAWAAQFDVGEVTWLDRLVDLAEAGLPTPPPTRECDSCGRTMTARPDSGTPPQYDGALPITFHGGYFGFIEDDYYGGTACTVVICPTCAKELCETVPWIGERLLAEDVQTLRPPT